MGINYSKIICANEVDKCTYPTAIPYPIYSRNVVNKNATEINKYVCGSHVGVVKQCCDPLDKSANDIVHNSNLIKSVRDNDGNYIKFQVCNCDIKNIECQKNYCKGFKLPTQYEKCRARAVDVNRQTKINDFVSEIVASNTYTNCYHPCQLD